MQIVKYATEQEAQEIIAQKQKEGLVLTHVSNITEGNFLGFKERAEEQSSIPVDSEFVLRLEAVEAKLDEVLKAVKK